MDISNNLRIGSSNQIKIEETKMEDAKIGNAKDNTVLDQEGFLKIIAANMTNPPIPGSSGEGSGSQTDFIGQMVQMNLLEQVTELTSSIQSTMTMTHQQQALSLVGKVVKVSGQEGKLVEGIVDKVRFNPDGAATIQVNGQEYYLQNVTEVKEAGKVEDSGNESDQSSTD